MLAVTALAIVKQTNLFAVAMLAGIYSLLSAALFTVMDAVDVAFTEAAVGAGISTVLMLGTMALVGHEAKKRSGPVLLPLFVVIVTGGVLVYGTLDMPAYGDPANPIHHHVADHYLEESGHEIGVPNVVTSVLASYRGYDTMGETTVIFTAMVAVLLLMAQISRKQWSDEERRKTLRLRAMEVAMEDNVILRVGAKILIPFILLFALYVQFHGDYGPGGGFQAGVIFAAGFILYGLIFGVATALKVLPLSVASLCGASGVLLYAGVGIATMFLGGDFLDYGVLRHDPEHGQHLGILLVELGVLITVFGVMVAIFYSFAGRRPAQR
jgi:multicomponent Na+:H+ antiporter subunit B